MKYLLGEFFGTLVLIVLGCGVVANMCLSKSKGHGGGWICISTGWGFAIVFGVFTATTLHAQGDLNPAVTLAKNIAGIYAFSEFVMITLAQLLGAFVGAVIVWAVYIAHWAETDDQAEKLAVFATGPAIRNISGCFIAETVATFFLMFLVWMIFSKEVGTIPLGLGPYVVGVLIWSLVISLGGVTGCAINPARDLGPRIAHAILPIPGKGSSDWGYAWVPIVGPCLGAVLAYFVAVACGVF